MRRTAAATQCARTVRSAYFGAPGLSGSTVRSMSSTKRPRSASGMKSGQRRPRAGWVFDSKADAPALGELLFGKISAVSTRNSTIKATFFEIYNPCILSHRSEVHNSGPCHASCLGLIFVSFRFTCSFAFVRTKHFVRIYASARISLSLSLIWAKQI